MPDRAPPCGRGLGFWFLPEWSVAAIAQRSQVHVLPPLPEKVQVKGLATGKRDQVPDLESQQKGSSVSPWPTTNPGE